MDLLFVLFMLFTIRFFGFWFLMNYIFMCWLIKEMIIFSPPPREGSVLLLQTRSDFIGINRIFSSYPDFLYKDFVCVHDTNWTLLLPANRTLWRVLLDSFSLLKILWTNGNVFTFYTFKFEFYFCNEPISLGILVCGWEEQGCPVWKHISVNSIHYKYHSLSLKAK